MSARQSLGQHPGQGPQVQAQPLSRIQVSLILFFLAISLAATDHVADWSQISTASRKSTFPFTRPMPTPSTRHILPFQSGPSRPWPRRSPRAHPPTTSMSAQHLRSWASKCPSSPSPSSLSFPSSWAALRTGIIIYEESASGITTWSTSPH